MTQARAIYAALAAFFLWVLTDVGIKLGGQSNLSPLLTMGALGAVGTVGLVAISLVRGRFAALYPTHVKGLAILVPTTVASSYATIVALRHLPLTLFYILVFTAPFFIAVLSTLVRHEVLTTKKLACLVAGFVGVVIAVGVQGTSGGDWIGYAAAFVSVVSFAVYTVTIRHLARDVSSESMLFITMLACAVCGLGSAAADLRALDGLGAALLLGSGLLNLAGSLFYNKALKHTASSNVAQIHYTQIISGALLGFLIWGEVPTVNLLLGGALIIGSGLVVAAQAHRDDRTQA